MKKLSEWVRHYNNLSPEQRELILTQVGKLRKRNPPPAFTTLIVPFILFSLLTILSGPQTHTPALLLTLTGITLPFCDALILRYYYRRLTK
jgi:hypothetical protein